MTVYVDQADKAYGRMKMCHMLADTTHELLKMALDIGVDIKHLQDSGSYREHFDICKSKRSLAIELGAVSVKNIEIGRMLNKRQKDLAQ